MRRIRFVLGMVLLAPLLAGTAQATWEGHAYEARLDCAVGALGGASNDLCPRPPGEPFSRESVDNELSFDVDPLPMVGAVFELRWWPDKQMNAEPFQLNYPLPDSDTVAVSANGKHNPRAPVVEGFSPLTIRLEETSPDSPVYWKNEGAALTVAVWPAPERHVVLGQSFTLAASFFYGEPVPEGFSYFDPATWPEDAPAAPVEGSTAGDKLASPANAAEPLNWILFAAGVTGPAGALLMAGPRRLRLLPSVLFSRLARGSVLDHPRRSELEAIVRADPGIRQEDARRALGLGDGLFRHHLHVLRRHRLLAIEKTFGGARLYPPASAATAPQAMSVQEQLLRLAAQRPGVSLRDAQRELAVPQRTLVYHARWLARKGYLNRRTEGNRILCYPADSYTHQGAMRKPQIIP